MEISISVDGRAVMANLGHAPQVTGTKLIANMRRLGQEYERYLKGELLSGQILEVRTGAGRRSIFYRLEVDANKTDVDLRVGADLGKARYMRALALGATIVPKKASKLAIPLEAARTASGVARFSAREVMANPQAFGYQGGAFVRNSIIFGIKEYKRAKRTADGRRELGEIVPLFVLKSRVVLPSRNYLVAARQAMDARTRELMDDVVTSTVRVFDTGAGGNGGGE